MAVSSANLVNLTMLSICIVLFSLPGVVRSYQNYSTFTKIQMPPGVTGPESASFNILGIGPYVTVKDGRILKSLGLGLGFIDFAYTSPYRTKDLCDGNTNEDLGPICGRPLGLSFDYPTGLLYIVDVYFGLLTVGPFGGLAKPVATSAEGVPFKFLTGVDNDLRTGNVYFSDASEDFDIRGGLLPQFKNDSTGRLMKYDPLRKEVTVLLRGLNGGGGPAVSSDGSYVLASEFRAGNIYKYWLRGPKANSAELLLHIAGNVNKIKRAGTVGEYWVATEVVQNQDGSTTTIPLGFSTPQGLRINGDGTVLQTVSFAAPGQFLNKTISVIQELRKALYVGSRDTDFIGKYTY